MFARFQMFFSLFISLFFFGCESDYEKAQRIAFNKEALHYLNYFILSVVFILFLIFIYILITRRIKKLTDILRKNTDISIIISGLIFTFVLTSYLIILDEKCKSLGELIFSILMMGLLIGISVFLIVVIPILESLEEKRKAEKERIRLYEKDIQEEQKRKLEKQKAAEEKLRQQEEEKRKRESEEIKRVEKAKKDILLAEEKEETARQEKIKQNRCAKIDQARKQYDEIYDMFQRAPYLADPSGPNILYLQVMKKLQETRKLLNLNDPSRCSDLDTMNLFIAEEDKIGREITDFEACVQGKIERSLSFQEAWTNARQADKEKKPTPAWYRQAWQEMDADTSLEELEKCALKNYLKD
jgi:uncharacterized membrane protein YjfL (UPF0719 family)